MIASELMEAGRAVQRGLVTTDRTTLIASTHRVYSIAEKSAMGDGRADSAALEARLPATPRSASSASTWRAASRAQRQRDQRGAVRRAVRHRPRLPFGREAFEATIRRGGVGVDASLRAFDEGAARWP